MDRVHLTEAICQLRAIRDATFKDVADAMASKVSELKLELYTNAVRAMSAEEIQRLEETGIQSYPRNTLPPCICFRRKCGLCPMAHLI